MTSAGGLEPLFTARGVDICCNYGFGQVPSTTSRLARRCLCNIMLLAEPTRQMFVDRCRAEEILKQMKVGLCTLLPLISLKLWFRQEIKYPPGKNVAYGKHRTMTRWTS